MIQNKQTELYGLVLAGGKSTRMGRDKGLISYHGLPQRDYLFELLSEICSQTFFSIRKDQLETIGHKPYIIDQDVFRGPFNGLLSAHDRFPKVAWLVIACDLPLMNKESLEQLRNERDQTMDATAFATQVSGLPEPLAAIWEPGGLTKAKKYLHTSESSCPRKFLLNHEVKLVFPKSDSILLNANVPEEYQEVVRKIQ